MGKYVHDHYAVLLIHSVNCKFVKCSTLLTCLRLILITGLSALPGHLEVLLEGLGVVHAWTVVG